jgi:hypothetical protein
MARHGRKARSLAHHAYSPALQDANIIWTEDTLDIRLVRSGRGGHAKLYQVATARDRLPNERARNARQPYCSILSTTRKRALPLIMRSYAA